MNTPNVTTLLPEHLNAPERILTELKRIKNEIIYLEAQEDNLKDELEQHFQNKTIGDVFTANGMAASRCTRKGSYKYSDDLTEKIRLMKEKEEGDGSAKRNPDKNYWLIRSKK